MQASTAVASSSSPSAYAAADGFQDLTAPLEGAAESPTRASVRDTLASIRTIRDTLATTASLGVPLEPVPHPAV